MSGYIENAKLPKLGIDGHDVTGEPTKLIQFENGSQQVINVWARTWNEVQSIAVELRRTCDPQKAKEGIAEFEKDYLGVLAHLELDPEDMFFLEEAHYIFDAENINYDIDMAGEPDDSFTNTVIGSMASAAKLEEGRVDSMFKHMGYNAFAPHLDQIFSNAERLKRDAAD